jgi:hypothetical protein
MNYINSINISTLIEDIRKATVLIDSQLEQFKHCLCFTFVDRKPDQMCLHCAIKSHTKRMNDYQTALQAINKNTIYFPRFIDIEAMAHAINTATDYKTEVSYRYDKKGKIVGAELHCRYSHYAMDGNGYHVGYEEVLFKLKGIEKSSLGIHSFPTVISAFVVNTEDVIIKVLSLPPEDKPTNESHRDDCPNRKRKRQNNWEECDCLDFNEGYYPPDEDFFYQEWENIVYQAMKHIPIAEFSNEPERVWTLGDIEYNIDKNTIDGREIE